VKKKKKDSSSLSCEKRKRRERSKKKGGLVWAFPKGDKEDWAEASPLREKRALAGRKRALALLGK